MKSKILTLILTLFITFNINAQDSLFVKVPKQYSFEFGYRNLFGQSNFVNNATHGYGALFDYAWQLSGFKGKKAKSFITVPMGYTVLLPDNGASKQINNAELWLDSATRTFASPKSCSVYRLRAIT